ncbi:hypothetical protein [Haloarcula salinisoli]|uniref:Uncharacterized protein n=1 Tax=Haloarcula salinisoli TaxID=2487746 RepID=A0A8J7YHQ9_9EURY|nr:hypothetical protein [Halomicroarcula salinisoli]MBX0302914.1 hypothetical protein [Halomicroarcula salinisoli]
MAVIVTALVGLGTAGAGIRLGHDDTERYVGRYRTRIRALVAIGIGMYASFVAAYGLFRGGFVSLLVVLTLVIVGLGLLRVLHGGSRPADAYRSPTDEEARRIRDCFDTFDATPGTVVVCTFEDSESPQPSAVFVTNSLGQRLTYVHEDLLDLATDDELAVAFAQATYRGPSTHVLAAASSTLELLGLLYIPATLNTLSLWAFDIGITALRGPVLPLLLVLVGLVVCHRVTSSLSRWSFTAADDFACRQFGTTAVRRTYRALGDWLVVDPEIDHNDRTGSGGMEPPLVRRIDRLGGDRTGETNLAATTGWLFAVMLAAALWVTNLLVRPVAAPLSTTLPAWLVGVASAVVGVALAAIPMLVVYRRHGSLIDTLPPAMRAELNTRWEFPLVVVCSIVVTELVVTGYLSFFWFAVAVLSLLLTGLNYRSRYDPVVKSRTSRPPSAAEADRLRSCLGGAAESVDRIHVHDTLKQYSVFVNGTDTHRTLHIEEGVLDISDDSNLAVTLAEADERSRQLGASGRVMYFLFVVWLLVLVETLTRGSYGPLAIGVVVVSLLAIPVVMVCLRHIAGRFSRIDTRLCDQYGTETVRGAYDTVGSWIENDRSFRHAWRLGLAPYPSMAARIARLPESDGRQPE